MVLAWNWSSHLKINWHKIFWFQNGSLNNILENYKGVYDNSLGRLKGTKQKSLLILHEGSQYSILLPRESYEGTKSVSGGRDFGASRSF